jgi:hypothetical protein
VALVLELTLEFLVFSSSISALDSKSLLIYMHEKVNEISSQYSFTGSTADTFSSKK